MIGNLRTSILRCPLYAPLSSVSVWRLKISSSWNIFFPTALHSRSCYSLVVTNSSSSVPFCPLNWKLSDQAVSVHLLVWPSIISFVYYLPAGFSCAMKCALHKQWAQEWESQTFVFCCSQSIEIAEVKGTVFKVGIVTRCESSCDQRRDYCQQEKWLFLRFLQGFSGISLWICSQFTHSQWSED